MSEKKGRVNRSAQRRWMAFVEQLESRQLLSGSTTAVAKADNIAVGGSDTENFTVNYSGDNALDTSTLDSSDVLVTGPANFSQLATFVDFTSNSDNSVTAQYFVPAPGGAWDAADNGTYTLTLQSAQVKDTNGNSAPQGAIGAFQVNVASFPAGSYNDMAYDSSGRLYVAYYDSDNKDLRFISRSPKGTWSTPTVIDDSSSDVGQYVSLALNSKGIPGVAYFDANHGDLKFAKLGSNGWQTSVVDSRNSVGLYPSLVFDSSDRPLISYYYKTGGDLRVANLKNGIWQKSTIDSIGDTGRSSNLVQNPVTGEWAIAYAGPNGQYKYVTLKKNIWRSDVVDTTVTGGGYVSLAFTEDGKPAFSYYDSHNADIKFAEYTGSKWQTQAVASKQSVGPYSSLVFLADGSAEITFFGKTHNSVYSVVGTFDHWQTTTEVTNGGRALTTVVGPTGGETLAWMDDTTGMLLVQPLPIVVLTQRLSPPTDLAAQALSSSSIKLTWTDNATGELGYWIERSVGGITNWTTVGATRPDTNTFTDNDLEGGTQYFYRVHAFAENATSTTVGPAATTTQIGTPSAPSGVAASALSSSQILVSWTDNSSNETGFRVDRSNDGSTGWTTVDTTNPNGVSLTDSNLEAGKTYYYRVTALSNSGNSSPANPASAQTNPGAPRAPSNVSASGLSSSTVMVSWSDNSSTETGFLVERSPDGSSGWTTAGQAAADTSQFVDTGLMPSTTYFYRVTALAASFASAAIGPVSATTAATDAPQYLLTPSVLADLRAKAQANTPQWQAFKSSLDSQLNQVIYEEYEGSTTLPLLGNYAMGYQVLEQIDPVTASAYADKAVALIEAGLHDDLRTVDSTRMFLASGDGTTKDFTLPNTDIDPATLKVWAADVIVQPIVKGTPGGQDSVTSYRDFLKVSNTPDGPADFTKGTDWQQNPNDPDANIDWSPSLSGGKEPATGATYYVTEAQSWGAPQRTVGTDYTFDGTALHFTTAPLANQAVFVEYLYGKPTQGVTTLGYQQTTDNRGGFNNVYIDDTYTSRNLKYVAIALDWLWDYRGFSEQLRTETETMLVRWSDYLRDNGYYKDSPASNYGASHYAFRMATAIALQGRDPADAARLKTEMIDYRNDNVLPLLEAPTSTAGSAQGGFWSEGWNYGSPAIQNILTSATAFESAGWGNISAEHAWSSQLIESLLEEQPSQSTIYDGGDGYTWPLTFPSNYWSGVTLLAETGSLTTDPAMRAYANWAIQNEAAPPAPNWDDLIFHDPDATASFWGFPSGLPLQYLSAGTGLVTARSDWSYNSTWLAFQDGELLTADHQTYAQGALQINRGADALLVDAPSVGELQTQWDKALYSNLVSINDGGAGLQRWPGSQDFAAGYFGNPTAAITHFEGASDYTYTEGDYLGAIGSQTGQNPATELTRSIFFIPASNYLIVLDRAATSLPTYTKQLQWHFLNAPTISGNSWIEAVGGSKLFGTTYSDTAITTTVKNVAVQNATVSQVAVNLVAPATSVNYVTALQTTGSQVASADASSHVESADGKVEGVMVGSNVVLFGKNGNVVGGTSYQISTAAGSTVTHYVADLTPGASYQLTGAEQTNITASPQGVATFTTTGTGQIQTVALTPA